MMLMQDLKTEKMKLQVEYKPELHRFSGRVWSLMMDDGLGAKRKDDNLAKCVAKRAIFKAERQ